MRLRITNRTLINLTLTRIKIAISLILIETTRNPAITFRTLKIRTNKSPQETLPIPLTNRVDLPGRSNHPKLDFNPVSTDNEKMMGRVRERIGQLTD
jgi:hypothetical protein